MFFKINFPTFKTGFHSVRAKSEKSGRYLAYIQEKYVFLHACTLYLYKEAAIS